VALQMQKRTAPDVAEQIELYRSERAATGPESVQVIKVAALMNGDPAVPVATVGLHACEVVHGCQPAT